MTIRKGVSILLAFSWVLLLTCPVVTTAQTDRFSGRTITGTIYYVGGRAAGRSQPFTLIVNRLSTNDEISQLNNALKSGGQDELMHVLTGLKAGRIQLGSNVGVPANAIIATQDGDRTKLTVLFERNLRIAELRYGTRSENYRFGYAEMYLGRGGNEGMLIPAAQVRLNGDTWVVEDFGTFPARLMGLQVRGRGRIG